MFNSIVIIYLHLVVCRKAFVLLSVHIYFNVEVHVYSILIKT